MPNNGGIMLRWTFNRDRGLVTQIQTWLKTHRLDAALLLVVGLFGLWSGWQARQIIADDAMITFRVAENLAFGRGFVFNPGEYVQVTTTPLYTLLVAAGTWLFGSAPAAALALNITLAALIPMLAYDTGRRLSGWITGLTGALLLSITPLLVTAFSMESYLYAALFLASVNAYLARRYRLAGVAIGLTAMLRGDAALVGACILTFDFVTTRRLRWAMIAPAIGLPLGWYAFAAVYYGSPLPATLQAKTAQGKINWLGDYFISGFGQYWHDWLKFYSRYFNVLPVLYLLGLIPVLRRERLWLIVIIHNLLYTAAFEGLRVTFAAWYYAPLTPGVALIIGRGVQLIAEAGEWLAGRLLRSEPARRTAAVAVPLAVTAGFLLFAWQVVYPVTADIIAANPDWKAQAYPPAARWIAQNTSTNATLATIDIGHLGYWSGRRIIDIVGLAQPDVAAHIAEGDFGYAIRQYQPDMVLLGATWLGEVQSKEWFQQAYPARHSLRLAGMDDPLVLFTRPTGIKAETEPIPAAALTPADVDFNRQIRLTGYHVSQPAGPGGTLNVMLRWRADAPIDNDFTVFVQLVDADNAILAQGDGKPQGGFYPTPFWQPGERITDAYTISLPAEIPPGRYDILLGFYEADSGARLQILDEAGQFKADHFAISGVEVKN